MPHGMPPPPLSQSHASHTPSCPPHVPPLPSWSSPWVDQSKLPPSALAPPIHRTHLLPDLDVRENILLTPDTKPQASDSHKAQRFFLKVEVQPALVAHSVASFPTSVHPRSRKAPLWQSGIAQLFRRAVPCPLHRSQLHPPNPLSIPTEAHASFLALSLPALLLASPQALSHPQIKQRFDSCSQPSSIPKSLSSPTQAFDTAKLTD